MIVNRIVPIFVTISLLYAPFGAPLALSTECPVDVPLPNVEIAGLTLTSTTTPALNQPIDVELSVINHESATTTMTFVLDVFRVGSLIHHLEAENIDLAPTSTTTLPFTFTITDSGTYSVSAGSYTTTGCNIEYLTHLLGFEFPDQEKPEECDCGEIGRDPARIRFGSNGKGDLLSVHGKIDPETAIDPVNEEIKVRLYNSAGDIYTLAIPAGTVEKKGKHRYRFYDSQAERAKDGLVEFSVQYVPRDDLYTFRLRTYGDLSLANDPSMGIKISIGDDCFLNESDWKKVTNGFYLGF